MIFKLERGEQQIRPKIARLIIRGTAGIRRLVFNTRGNSSVNAYDIADIGNITFLDILSNGDM